MINELELVKNTFKQHGKDLDDKTLNDVTEEIKSICGVQKIEDLKFPSFSKAIEYLRSIYDFSKHTLKEDMYTTFLFFQLFNNDFDFLSSIKNDESNSMAKDLYIMKSQIDSIVISDGIYKRKARDCKRETIDYVLALCLVIRISSIIDKNIVMTSTRASRKLLPIIKDTDILKASEEKIYKNHNTNDVTGVILRYGFNEFPNRYHEKEAIDIIDFVKPYILSYIADYEDLDIDDDEMIEYKTALDNFTPEVWKQKNHEDYFIADIKGKMRLNETDELIKETIEVVLRRCKVNNEDNPKTNSPVYERKKDKVEKAIENVKVNKSTIRTFKKTSDLLPRPEDSKYLVGYKDNVKNKDGNIFDVFLGFATLINLNEIRKNYSVPAITINFLYYLANLAIYDKCVDGYNKELMDISKNVAKKYEKEYLRAYDRLLELEREVVDADEMMLQLDNFDIQNIRTFLSVLSVLSIDVTSDKTSITRKWLYKANNFTISEAKNILSNINKMDDINDLCLEDSNKVALAFIACVFIRDIKFHDDDKGYMELLRYTIMVFHIYAKTNPKEEAPQKEMDASRKRFIKFLEEYDDEKDSIEDIIKHLNPKEKEIARLMHENDIRAREDNDAFFILSTNTMAIKKQILRNKNFDSILRQNIAKDNFNEDYARALSIITYMANKKFKGKLDVEAFDAFENILMIYPSLLDKYDLLNDNIASNNKSESKVIENKNKELLRENDKLKTRVSSLIEAINDERDSRKLEVKEAINKVEESYEKNVYDLEQKIRNLQKQLDSTNALISNLKKENEELENVLFEENEDILENPINLEDIIGDHTFAVVGGRQEKVEELYRKYPNNITLCFNQNEVTKNAMQNNEFIIFFNFFCTHAHQNRIKAFKRDDQKINYCRYDNIEQIEKFLVSVILDKK